MPVVVTVGGGYFHIARFLRSTRRLVTLKGGKLRATGRLLTVENMFPVRPLGSRRDWQVSGFRPSVDPTDVGHRHYTLDLSHTATAGMDAMALAARMGAGLCHVHLTDGSGTPRDEHLLPGTGTQPCAELCASRAPRATRASLWAQSPVTLRKFS